jgi:hypothetical protein
MLKNEAVATLLLGAMVVFPLELVGGRHLADIVVVASGN